MSALRVLAFAIAAFIIVEALVIAGFDIFFKADFVSVTGMAVFFALLIAEMRFLTLE